VSRLGDMMCVKETYCMCKRDLCQMEMRPMFNVKEMYVTCKKGLCIGVKETYIKYKRDIFSM